MMLSGLLSAGRESGVLVRSEHGWRLRGALRAHHELYDLLEFRLRSLGPPELEAVEVLAAAQVLDWEILRGLCDADAVANLERAGVVRTRQLNGVLAQHLRKRMQTHEQRSKLPDLRTRIRLAQFMRSDLEPDLDVIIDAAASAVAMSNIALGKELAQFAFDDGGGLPAAIVLADALRWHGRRDEAEALLAGVDLGSADEWLTVKWGCLRAPNLLFGRGQCEQAWLLLAKVRDCVESPETAGLVKAIEGPIACFSGDIATAIRLGPPLCASDQQPYTMTWAVSSTCWALAVAGRLGEVQGAGELPPLSGNNQAPEDHAGHEDRVLFHPRAQQAPAATSWSLERRAPPPSRAAHSRARRVVCHPSRVADPSLRGGSGG